MVWFAMQLSIFFLNLRAWELRGSCSETRTSPVFRVLRYFLWQEVHVCGFSNISSPNVRFVPHHRIGNHVVRVSCMMRVSTGIACGVSPRLIYLSVSHL